MVDKKRKFLGKTEGFLDKQEANFEKAHLKAYLRGQERFPFGFTHNMFGQRIPFYHEVKQGWI